MLFQYTIAVAKSIVVPLCICLRVVSQIHEQLQSTTAVYSMKLKIISLYEMTVKLHATIMIYDVIDKIKFKGMIYQSNLKLIQISKNTLKV
jgi:hypothetical protein